MADSEKRKLVEDVERVARIHVLQVHIKNNIFSMIEKLDFPIESIDDISTKLDGESKVTKMTRRKSLLLKEDGGKKL